MKRKNLIIGIGTKAKDTIDNLYIKKRNFDFLCFNNKKQFLNLSKLKTVWFNDNEFQQTKGDMEYHIEILRKKNDILKKELKKYKYAVVIMYSGEQFVSKTSKEFIKYLKEHISNFDILCISPFKKDVIANHYSNTTLNNLKDMSPNLFIYHSDDIFKISNPETIIEAEYNISYKIGEILKMIFELRSKENF